MISVFLVRALVETVERTSAPRSDFCLRVGLDPQFLDDPTAKLDFDQFERVVATALALTDDHVLGLHVAERMTPATLDVLAHVTGHAPTIREAVTVSSEFGSLALEGMRLVVTDERDRAVVRCEFPRSSAVSDRLLAELMMAGLARLVRTFLGPRGAIRAATFEYDRPIRSGEYTRIFGQDLRFRRDATAMVLDREDVDRPQMNQHPELFTLLRAEAERRLDVVETRAGTAVRLRRYLLAIPPARFPNIATAARDLGMSARSLRRHLAAEGTSYRQVVQSSLEASASRLLRDPTRAIKETAATLGFADAAAFVRAFRRWTGTTPGEYRRAGRGG